MPYELFLALRYLRSRRRGGAGAQATALVAVVGVACGVGALVVAMALANGFRDEMRDKILRGTAHVTLSRSDGGAFADWRALAGRVRAVEGVTDAAPTSYEGSLLAGPRGASYAVLRGVDADSGRELSEIRRTLASGSVERLFDARSDGGGARPGASDGRTKDEAGGDETGAGGGRSDGAAGDSAGGAGALGFVADGPPTPVVVGAELAARTGLESVGDEGWLVAGEVIDVPPGLAPRARRVRVVGLFRTGLYEYDSTWAYVPLADAAGFAPRAGGGSHAAGRVESPGATGGGSHAAGGVERAVRAAASAPVLNVETADIYRANEVAARLRASLGAGFTVVDWQEANRPLFAALELERRTVAFIVALIVLVAALNITTTLVLVVVERRADIAVLGAMGARARSVLAIFVCEGAIIGAAGALAGVALGLAACAVGGRYKVVRLPAEVYSLGHIPFHPRASETALAALAAFAVCLVATLYPARKAARTRPADALRYE